MTTLRIATVILLACGLAGGDEMELKTLKAENAALRRQVKGLRVQVAELKAADTPPAATTQPVRPRARVIVLRKDVPVWWRKPEMLAMAFKARQAIQHVHGDESPKYWLPRNDFFVGKKVLWELDVTAVTTIRAEEARRHYHRLMAGYREPRPIQARTKIAKMLAATRANEDQYRKLEITRAKNAAARGGAVRISARCSWIEVTVHLPASDMSRTKGLRLGRRGRTRIRVEGTIEWLGGHENGPLKIAITGTWRLLKPDR